MKMILVLNCKLCRNNYEIEGKDRDECSKRALAEGWEEENYCPRCSNSDYGPYIDDLHGR
jgi:hypothetical protein